MQEKFSRLECARNDAGPADGGNKVLRIYGGPAQLQYLRSQPASIGEIVCASAFAVHSI
jgi:hypothetical protein